MRRGIVWGFPVAVTCLLAGLLTACGGPASDQASPSSELSRIAVSVATDGVYLVDPASGSRSRVVEDLGDFRAGYATWSPDHVLLAYAEGGIVVLDPRTNRHTMFVRGEQLSMPAWDLDGTHVAYSDGLTLWVTSLGKVAPRRIHVPAILAPLDLAWGSTDLIAFEGVDLDCSQAVRCVSTGSSEIWVIRPDGTELRRVTDAGHAESPKWWPDGTRLLFVRRHSSTAKDAELWTTDPEGLEQRRLLASPGIVAADWSPDGSRLAVIRTGERSNTLELWVGRSDGSGLRRLGRPFPGTHATVDW